MCHAISLDLRITITYYMVRRLIYINPNNGLWVQNRRVRHSKTNFSFQQQSSNTRFVG